MRIRLALLLSLIFFIASGVARTADVRRAGWGRRYLERRNVHPERIAELPPSAKTALEINTVAMASPQNVMRIIVGPLPQQAVTIQNRVKRTTLATHLYACPKSPGLKIGKRSCRTTIYGNGAPERLRNLETAFLI